MDIALHVNSDGQFDIAIANGEPREEAGLETAVHLSLFCDRHAAADDVLPAGDDRRGWWADRFFAEPMGSRIWLTLRSARTPGTLRLIEDYASEAMRWLVTSGIADTVSITAEFEHINDVRLNVRIARPEGTSRYDLTWRGQSENRPFA